MLLQNVVNLQELLLQIKERKSHYREILRKHEAIAYGIIRNTFGW